LLAGEHIEKIIDTCRERPENLERFARRVEMKEIETIDFKLNISRYVSQTKAEATTDILQA